MPALLVGYCAQSQTGDKSAKKKCRNLRTHTHAHTQNTEDVSVQQTAEPVTECNCEMIIGKSGWWIDWELAMSQPSPLILSEGCFSKGHKNR